MKKVSIILFTIIVSYGAFMVSCSNNKAAEEKRQRDAFVADSLNNVRLDSLALIAWGQAKFGMSQEEVLATETFAGSYIYSNSISLKFEKKNAYRESFHLKRMFSDFDAQFKDDELYQIMIKSYCYEWDQLRYLERDCDYFVNQFREKYGAPDRYRGSVQASYFTNGEEFLYALFKIKNKTISIQMGEDSYQYQPYYRIYIWNNDFPKKPHVETLEEIEIREQKEKNEQFSNNNSF